MSCAQVEHRWLELEACFEVRMSETLARELEEIATETQLSKAEVMMARLVKP